MLDYLAAPAYSELHPEDVVFFPRTNLENTQGIVKEHYLIESLTGATVGLTGDMPLICHRANITDLALEFLQLAGLGLSEQLLAYGSEDEALAIAQECVGRGEKLAYIFPPLPELDNPECLTVSGRTYGRLNNKAFLPEYVRESYVPERQYIPTEEGIDTIGNKKPGYPVYLKGAAGGANGGGELVRYCHDEASWQQAVEWYQSCEYSLSGFIIEKAIHVELSWCLGVAILDDSCRYLGGAIQLFDQPVVQSGSRIDPDYPVPAEAIDIVLDISRRAQQEGYRGIAGFDIGITRENRLYVFDLNFRLNGSTNQILLHDAATERTNSRVSQSWAVQAGGTLRSIMAGLSPFVKTGEFVPLKMFDKDVYHEYYPEEQAYNDIRGIIVADTAEDIAVLDVRMKEAVNNR